MKTMNNSILTKLLCLVVLGVLAGCSGSNSSSVSSGTGAILAKLQWGQAKSTAASNNFSAASASLPQTVAIVRITVTGPDMAAIQASFKASDGQGLIDEVPTGTNRTVLAEALDSSGTVTFEGSVSGISVSTGQTTDAGTIIMQPVGGTTLPSGFPANIPSGDYNVSVMVCSQGICNSAGSITQINTDINAFAQALMDALNASVNQNLAADCAQSGCSCPASTVSFTPWDGTSFTITDGFDITCNGTTSSVSIQFIISQGTAPAGLDFTTLPGLWTGQWSNLTFGTTGGVQLDASSNGTAAQAVLTLSGNVFGSPTPPPPIILGAPLTPGATSLSFAATGTSIGDVHATISADGHLQGAVTNLPSSSLSGVAIIGTVTSTLISADYTITFTNGSSAQGTLTLTK